MAGVREMFWKEKIQPGLRETRCIQRHPSFSVWSFFSSHPPWISSHPSTCRIWSIPVSSRVIPSPCRPRQSSPRHCWSLWNASTNTDKLLENKHCPGAADRVQEGRPGSRGQGHRCGGRDSSLLPALPAASGEGSDPEDGEAHWGHWTQLKIHIWSNCFNFLTPFLELFPSQITASCLQFKFYI